jgi:hypothetical protein
MTPHATIIALDERLDCTTIQDILGFRYRISSGVRTVHTLSLSACKELQLEFDRCLSNQIDLTFDVFDKL